MKIVAPIAFTDITLGGSTVDPDVETAWGSGATYAVGDRCKYETSAGATPGTTVHRIYKRLVAGAGTVTPNLDVGNWQDVGPTNRWACLDTSISTQTICTVTTGLGSEVLMLGQVMPTSGVDTLSLFGLVGTSVVVQIWARTSLLNYTVAFSATYAINGVDGNPDQLTVTDLAYPPPPTASYGALIVVYIDGPQTIGYKLKCGVYAIGQSIDMGVAQYSPTINLISYSRKETDEFGVTTFVKRANSKRVTVKTMIDNANMDSVWRAVSMLDGIPCVVIVSDITDLKPLNAFGFIKDFSIDVAYVNQSLCSIEFESLV